MSQVNNSGVIPVEYKVLVLPDPVEDRTPGGLWKPDITKNMEKYLVRKGTLVAVGGNAFEEWKPPIPRPGDRVYVSVGAGICHRCEDGKEYYLVNDKDIVAIITEEAG